MRYAIIESGGKQYKAVEGETLEVDRLHLEAGKKVDLKEVLLVSDGENVLIGSPTLSGAKVAVTVVDEFKGPKVVVFKYRPRKRYRVKRGHRQLYTRLLVDSIEAKGFPSTPAHEELPAADQLQKASGDPAPTKVAASKRQSPKAARPVAPKKQSAKAAKPAAPKKESKASAPSTRKRLSSFEFNARTLSALEEAGFSTVAAVLSKLEEGDPAVLEINGVGPAALDEIKSVLKKAGYKLPK
jgi:large subunit ribosomal protein L21